MSGSVREQLALLVDLHLDAQSGAALPGPLEDAAGVVEVGNVPVTLSDAVAGGMPGVVVLSVDWFGWFPVLGEPVVMSWVSVVSCVTEQSSVTVSSGARVVRVEALGSEAWTAEFGRVASMLSLAGPLPAARCVGCSLPSPAGVDVCPLCDGRLELVPAAMVSGPVARRLLFLEPMAFTQLGRAVTVADAWCASRRFGQLRVVRAASVSGRPVLAVAVSDAVVVFGADGLALLECPVSQVTVVPVRRSRQFGVDVYAAGQLALSLFGFRSQAETVDFAVWFEGSELDDGPDDLSGRVPRGAGAGLAGAGASVAVVGDAVPSLVALPPPPVPVLRAVRAGVAWLCPACSSEVVDGAGGCRVCGAALDR